MQLATETVGWIGSALIIISLAQPQPRRLHRLNICACVVLIAYNALIGAVPGIALNAGLILVNLWRLRALQPAAAVGNRGPGDDPSGTDTEPGPHCSCSSLTGNGAPANR